MPDMATQQSAFQRYFDGSLTLQSSNPVRRNELQRIADRIFVDSIPIGSGSGVTVAELQIDDPEKDLMRDGRYWEAQLRITEPKLAQAFAVTQVPLVVADAGLYLHGMFGQPGPNIKADMDDDVDRTNLRALCLKAHTNSAGNPYVTWVEGMGVMLEDGKQILVTGSVTGRVAKEPSPMKGYGFDDILIVEPDKQVELSYCGQPALAVTVTELIHSQVEMQFPELAKDKLSARAVALARLGKELGLKLTEFGDWLLEQHPSEACETVY